MFKESSREAALSGGDDALVIETSGLTKV